VADHEFGLDVEPDVGDLEMRPRRDGALYQQRADRQAFRSPSEKAVTQVGQGETAVEDVFDDEDVATGQVDVEVFQDPYDAARLRRGSIGGDGHEVELERQLNAAGEVGEE